MGSPEKKEKNELESQTVAKEASKAAEEVKEEETKESDKFTEKDALKAERESLEKAFEKTAEKVKAEPAETEEKAEKKPKAKNPPAGGKNTKKTKAHKHSQKYFAKASEIDKTEHYPIAEALELVKKVSYAKFGGSVDLHVKIAKSRSKKDSTETFRAIVDLPNGSGKTKIIAILTEELIEEIAKEKTAKADIYLASPEIMPKVGKIARILGTQGKMPSPKSGTVTSDIEKTKESLEGGRVELRADASNVLHQTIGRVDWDLEKLQKNYEAVMAVLPKTRIFSVVLAPTMGPGVKVAFKK